MENYFDTAPCYYFAFDDSGKILTVNQTICNALGYSKEALLHQSVEMIFPVSTRIFYQTHFFPLIKMHGHAEEIFIFLKARNNEQIPVLMNAQREELSGLVHNNCVCLVVKNRKKFEDELVRAKQVAETALSENTALKKAREELFDKTEQLDHQIQIVNRQNVELRQFSRIATHNLQEPIRKMLLFTGMLQAALQGENVQKEKVLKLQSVSTQMREIVRGLQEYVWLGETANQSSLLDLNSIMTGVKEQLQIDLKEGPLSVYTEGLPNIMADREQIKLLFYHLLKNAVQYKKPYEKVTVIVSASVVKKNYFKSVTGKYHYQDVLQITVKDKGIGFETQYKEIIFELFKKLHHLDRRGIGLSLCKKIVENHGGWIEAESTPSVGTNIFISFPVSMVIGSN